MLWHSQLCNTRCKHQLRVTQEFVDKLNTQSLEQLPSFTPGHTTVIAHKSNYTIQGFIQDLSLGGGGKGRGKGGTDIIWGKPEQALHLQVGYLSH